MNAPLKTLPRPDADPLSLKEAMRRLVGGVAVITAGIGDERTGLTATSAVSLSMDPPTMLICVNRSASSWPVIDCDVSEIIERHSHAIILGAVRDVCGDLGDGNALVYGHGRFGSLNLL